MVDKGFGIFDECASRCVYLSPQEEDWTSSSWGDSKMYTFTSMASLQSMIAEISESGAIAKVSIWVEVILQTLKSISNNFQRNSNFISYPELIDNILVVCVFRYFLTFIWA